MLHRSCVFHPVGFAGHIVHSGVSSVRNVDALFFKLGWDRYGFEKNHTGTRDAELVFLHPVGSVGHTVHSGGSGPQNTEVNFFMLGWAWCSFHKRASGYVELNLSFCILWDL
jgi:hypothetical protein